MKVSTITTTKTTVFYTVVTPEQELHFFSLWEMIAFLSKIDLESQKN